MMMTTLIIYIILYYYIKYYNIYVYKYIFYLSYTDDIQMIEDVDSGINTGMKNNMNKIGPVRCKRCFDYIAHTFKMVR